MHDAYGILLGFTITFFVLTWTTVSIRVYVKARMLKTFGWDDYMLLAALATYTGFLVSQVMATVNGEGQQLDKVTTAHAETALKFMWFSEVFYVPSTSLLKVSVGLFLFRFPLKTAHVWVIWTLIAGSVLVGTTYFLLMVLQCHPTSFWWDLDPTHHGKCINPTAITVCGYIISAINSAADIGFAASPIIMVWGTTMSRRVRLMVCVLIGFASIACIATIVRLPYIDTLNNPKSIFLYKTPEVAVLSTIEVGLGMTAASAATFRPLVQRWLGPRRPNAGFINHGGVSISRRGSKSSRAIHFGDMDKSRAVVSHQSLPKLPALYEAEIVTTVVALPDTSHAHARDRFPSDETTLPGDQEHKLDADMV